MSSRTFSGGLEFGRGRAGGDESSSSRESSPNNRKRKRSFSPRSDDGDPDVPPIADDDTPPPAQRPLIRQAVAFGGATAVALPTDQVYEATLPTTTNSSFMFLPGQAPPAAKKSVPKRKKKNDAYKSQAGRFRLETYDATPSEMPPTQHGAGPYASAFRGYTDQRAERSESPAMAQRARYPSISSSTLHSDRSPSPVLRGSSTRGGYTASRNKSGSHNRASRSDTPGEARVPSTSQLPTPITEYRTSSSTAGNYYRLNYETGQKLDPPTSTLPASMPPMVDTNAHTPNGNRNLALSNLPQTQPTENTSAPPRKHGARVVSIYAQDIRSGYVDNQLIEVQVPIRPADNPSEAYWADAKDLMEQWQKSPARVDGPARVYILRGKYRQILLRVSATNVDEAATANVVLKRDLSVEVVVENLPAPGVRPPPPQLLNTLIALDHQPVDVEGTYQGIPSPTKSYGPPSNRNEDSRSNRNSDHEYSEDEAPCERPRLIGRVISSPSEVPPTAPSTTVVSPRRSSISAPPEITHGQTETRARLKPQRKLYDSPCSDDEPDKVQQAIRKVVDQLVQKDDKEKWKDFFKLKGRLETASNMVARYRFVQDLLDKYVGQPVPFRSRRDFPIEANHILAALMIDDSDGRFVAHCRETLDLLKLYGKDGERYEDAEVVKLMEEQDVAYNGKPIKRLLHLLRDVDKKWQT